MAIPLPLPILKNVPASVFVRILLRKVFETAKGPENRAFVDRAGELSKSRVYES